MSWHLTGKVGFSRKANPEARGLMVMRISPAALAAALLLLTCAPASADTALPPGDDGAGPSDGGPDIAACIDAAKRRDADATIDFCTRALDAGQLGTAPTVAALVNRGLAHVAENDPAAAIPDFDRAILLQPEVAAFYDMRAMAHAMQGEGEPAIRDYAEVLRRGGEDADPAERLLRQGVAAHLDGDDHAAEELFAQAQGDAQKGSTEALHALLWRNLMQQASRQNALPSLNAAAGDWDLEQWPGPLIRYYQGEVTELALEQALDDPDPAVSAAHACDATFFVAARALVDDRFGVAQDGFAHVQTLCAPETIAFTAARAEAIAAARPVSDEVQNDMKQCQAADANGESAPIIEYCGKAIAHPDAPDVWRIGALTRRATAYRAQGDLDRALADLDAALALRPDSVGIYRTRSLYRREKGDSMGGLADLAEALRLQPNFVPAYVDRAWVRVSGGDIDGARADFGKAAAVEPDQPRLHLFRGVVAYLAGDDTEAAADFSTVIQANQQAPYAVLWLALTDRRRAVADDGTLQSGLAALDLEQWPGPVIRFVQGEISADDLAAAAASPDPETAQKQDCEASFYGGAIADDGATARAQIEHARSVCSPDNIEYHAAEGMLAGK